MCKRCGKNKMPNSCGTMFLGPVLLGYPKFAPSYKPFTIVSETHNCRDSLRARAADWPDVEAVSQVSLAPWGNAHMAKSDRIGHFFLAPRKSGPILGVSGTAGTITRNSRALTRRRAETSIWISSSRQGSR